MTTGTLVLAWYYHLPAITSDQDVEELVRNSLEPLLSAHRTASQPVILAITGCLLQRLDRLSPATVESIAALAAAGTLEVAGTFHHEVFPPIVPLPFLTEHIRRDLALKADVLEVEPKLFFPGNFAWVPAMTDLLGRAGIEGVILDEDHYRAASSVQTWKWEAHERPDMSTTMLDTILSRTELYRPHSLRTQGDGLTLLFRDYTLVRQLSFGNSGALHRPLDTKALDRVLEDVSTSIATGDLRVIADDGDRINPVSLYNYERFLAGLPSERTNLDLTASLPPTTVFEYLPSHAAGGSTEFWLADLDSLHYTQLLRDVYMQPELVANNFDEIMELQDVFFLFWKNISRKQEYLSRLVSLLSD